MNKKSFMRLVPLFLVLAVAGLVLWREQALVDWWKLRGYKPPSAVAQLAAEDTMMPYTQHLFYLNKPQLLTSVDAFRDVCPRNKETIVLGCYHPNQDGIFIYAVSDPTLAGIQQVTAAHEVLHAVYARLNGSQRLQLDTELENYYQHGLTDPNVKAEIVLYQQTEPESVYDEMSCTFGTEMANLPADLNSYYAKYFSNRQKIVAYEQEYRTQFASREQQVSAADAKLSSLKTQIADEETSLTSENANLASQSAQLQKLLASNRTSTYNAAVASYNAQVDSYNAQLADLKQQIADYNDEVAARNAIAGQLDTLVSAIDTRVPAPISP